MIKTWSGTDPLGKKTGVAAVYKWTRLQGQTVGSPSSQLMSVCSSAMCSMLKQPWRTWNTKLIHFFALQIAYFVTYLFSGVLKQLFCNERFRGKSFIFLPRKDTPNNINIQLFKKAFIVKNFYELTISSLAYKQLFKI